MFIKRFTNAQKTVPTEPGTGEDALNKLTKKQEQDLQSVQQFLKVCNKLQHVNNSTNSL